MTNERTVHGNYQSLLQTRVHEDCGNLIQKYRKGIAFSLCVCVKRGFEEVAITPNT